LEGAITITQLVNSFLYLKKDIKKIKLLVHNQVTGSQYGNCLEMLDSI